MSLTRIATFYDPEEAYCAKGFLESHGFEVCLLNEHHLSANPAFRVALGGFGLAVPTTDSKAAWKALREIESSPDVSPPDTCASCGSTDLVRARRMSWLPLALISGVPFLPLRRARKCAACGARVQD
jgi:hypothetical protein